MFACSLGVSVRCRLEALDKVLLLGNNSGVLACSTVWAIARDFRLNLRAMSPVFPNANADTTLNVLVKSPTTFSCPSNHWFSPSDSVSSYSVEPPDCSSRFWQIQEKKLNFTSCLHRVKEGNTLIIWWWMFAYFRISSEMNISDLRELPCKNKGQMNSMKSCACCEFGQINPHLHRRIAFLSRAILIIVKNNFNNCEKQFKSSFIRYASTFRFLTRNRSISS